MNESTAASTITIPVDEYKDLLQAKTELLLIYNKSQEGPGYEMDTFVRELRKISSLDPVRKTEAIDAE